MNADQVNRVLLSTLRFPIRWGDMDAMAHVNNTLYFRYFEESRVSWSQHIGRPLRPVGSGMILAKAAVTFIKPVTYPANVIVDLYAGPIGRASFTLLNTLTVEGDDKPAATGECIIVWYDYENSQSAPVPDELRAILEGRGR